MPSGSDYDHPLWIYLGLGLRLLMTKLPKSKKKKKKNNVLWLQFYTNCEMSHSVL